MIRHYIYKMLVYDVSVFLLLEALSQEAMKTAVR